MRERNISITSSLLPEMPIPEESSLVLNASPLEADEFGRKWIPSSQIAVGTRRKASSRSTASDTTYESNILDVSGDETEDGGEWTLRLREADEAHLDDL